MVNGDGQQWTTELVNTYVYGSYNDSFLRHGLGAQRVMPTSSSVESDVHKLGWDIIKSWVIDVSSECLWREIDRQYILSHVKTSSVSRESFQLLRLRYRREP